MKTFKVKTTNKPKTHMTKSDKQAAKLFRNNRRNARGKAWQVAS